MSTDFLRTLENRYKPKCECANLVTRHEYDENQESFSYEACADCNKRIGAISYNNNTDIQHQSDEQHQQDDCSENDQYKTYNVPNYSTSNKRRRKFTNKNLQNHYITRRKHNIEFLGKFTDDVKETVIQHKNHLSIDVTISMQDFYNKIGHTL